MHEIFNHLDKIPNPCFVLEESVFIKNMEQFNFIEKASGGSVLCALKGFSMWSVFPDMKSYISGGTASSLNEAKLIHDEMGLKAHCCFVVYSASEFTELQTIASHITFNSLSQVEKFKGEFKDDIKYGIRINPAFSDVSFAKYNPCMPGSRLGITKEKLSDTLPAGITGIHFHALCESNSSDLENLLVVIESDFGHLLHQAEWVNIGGGQTENILKSRKNNPSKRFQCVRASYFRYLSDNTNQQGGREGHFSRNPTGQVESAIAIFLFAPKHLENSPIATLFASDVDWCQSRFGRF